MRFIIYLLYSALIALGIGLGLSFYALTDGRLVGARQIGPWLAWPETGSPRPDPYTRAYLARQGILPLGSTEGLQLIAETDSDGQLLDRACTYVLDGKTPTSTMWTLIAIDESGRNIAASNDLPYLDSLHLSRAADGSAMISIGPDLAPGDWLEIAGTGPYAIALTLYDTTAGTGTDWSSVEMPSITRAGC